MHNKKTNKTFYVIYLLAFLMAFHIALLIYVESNFVETTLNRLDINNIGKFVGIIYSAAALVTLVVFLNISKILTKFGNFKLAFVFFSIEMLTLLGLAFIKNPVILIAVFITHLIVMRLVFFNIDLFLEGNSNDESTGTTRGMFLTSTSIAFVIAPLMAGFILTNGDFWKLFFISGFIMIPAILLLYLQFHDHEDPVYDNLSLKKTLKEIWERKNIYKIMMSAFLLRFFYSWMVVYIPIYLHKEIGLSLSNIVGTIIPIALLPFILFQFMLGKIADEKLGEKEILTVGFIIAGFTTMLLSFTTSTSLMVWALLLFATRIGASFIEIMTETYFYKKIDATDTHLMGCFRTLIPLAYLIGPLTATFFLMFFEYKYLFVTLGIIMLFGLKYSLTIEDTK
ncbi:MAG: MFS transporter, partial [Candidatus Pacebacteria bacterium]|nr:MFS transporter [Candidatus Paceibacterota bacterium]